MPTRGSFSSRTSSARSRWIWSATRKLRLGIECLCFVMIGPQAETPSGRDGVFCVLAEDLVLESSGDFLDLEKFELVAFLDIGDVLELDAALEALGHPAH